MSVDIQRLIGSSFISFMLSYMLMKAWLPFAPQRPGQVLLEVRLGLLQRLLIHRTQAVLLLLYLVIGSLPATGDTWFLPGTQPVAMAALAVILMLPLRYVLTDRGVALGRGVPRLYRSFRRFDARPGRGWLQTNTTIILHGRKLQRGTAPSLRLFLPTGSVAAVTRVLKRHLR